MLNYIINNVFNKQHIHKYAVSAFIPGLIFFIVAFVGLKSVGFSTMQILRDLAQQAEVSSFLGFLSNIGVWAWVASFSIAYFAAIYLYQGRQRQLLILMALLATALGFDDFFLIHDRYINQNICYAAYAIIALSILALHFKDILKINAFAFLIAGGLLAASIMTDIVQGYLPFGYANVQIVEEGFKFLGAISWLYFTCYVASKNHLSK
ncbi:TPA: oxidase [Photobacterium damselae]|uniref:oxidase n=1 Tax=Photobacterium damselae TaxID=38293 RepID=UPI00165DA5EC|nr:oxidase [Photobacterium damselae]EJN6960958.1 oxidase [Photobacterium damselae]UJZ95204.1 oxidase [Photobacterium damselae subsp. damselae]UJZ99185.1 oxidase [Photobacterium damselae subsp. damselae]UKA07556.1 oxidase [Photobacterium damselae subsp. damselae]UKA11443.1 oxidase [Photobacterium damselae subsp. damselae]